MPSHTNFSVHTGCNYPGSGYDLSGCVRDGERLAAVFKAADYEAVLRAEPTRQVILDLIADAADVLKPGDSFALTLSGHGTTLPKVGPGGDETSAYDQAFCPSDFLQGRFLRDDDLGLALEAFDPGVSVLLIVDCCYSGSITRIVGENAPGTMVPGLGRRPVRVPRFIPFLPLPVRQAAAGNARMRGAKMVGATVQADVLSPGNLAAFQACRDIEVAYESAESGVVMGDFTRRLCRVLESAGRTIYRGTVHQRVLDAFGPNRSQTPVLYAPNGAKRRFFGRAR
jgi:hypothetical protein